MRHSVKNPEQALAVLAAEFPLVPGGFRHAVLRAFVEQRHMPIGNALTAARQRIADACAV